jgi:hypothetical protein
VANRLTWGWSGGVVGCSEFLDTLYLGCSIGFCAADELGLIAGKAQGLCERQIVLWCNYFVFAATKMRKQRIDKLVWIVCWAVVVQGELLEVLVD